jgi:signal peptidase II
MKKFLIFTALLVLVDQITKYLMQGKSLINSGFISLTYKTNYGAAFGILQGWKVFFIIVTIAVIVAIFYYYNKTKHKVALTLLLAGSIGNLIDRIFLGYVRDFIFVKHFSTFNLADVFNVVAVAIIIYYQFKEKT